MFFGQNVAPRGEAVQRGFAMNLCSNGNAHARVLVVNCRKSFAPCDGFKLQTGF